MSPFPPVEANVFWRACRQRGLTARTERVENITRVSLYKGDQLLFTGRSAREVYQWIKDRYGALPDTVAIQTAKGRALAEEAMATAKHRRDRKMKALVKRQEKARATREGR